MSLVIALFISLKKIPRRRACMLNFGDERERGKKQVTDQCLEGCHLGKSICIISACICRNRLCKDTPRAGNWAPGRKTKAKR